MTKPRERPWHPHCLKESYMKSIQWCSSMWKDFNKPQDKSHGIIIGFCAPTNLPNVHEMWFELVKLWVGRSTENSQALIPACVNQSLRLIHHHRGTEEPLVFADSGMVSDCTLPHLVENGATTVCRVPEKWGVPSGKLNITMESNLLFIGKNRYFNGHSYITRGYFSCHQTWQWTTPVFMISLS